MMSRVTSAIALAVLLIQLSSAHTAIDCFETTPLKGGNAANSLEANDLDLLLNTSLNHAITTIKVCTNRQAD